MATITVRAHFAQTPDVVWEELRHIERHVHWMLDAVAITFDGERREGVGTSFRCVTKVGPVRLTDLMTITEWSEGRVMGVAHRGIVRGVGSFTLTAHRGGTMMTWSESLTMPWLLGGRAGSWLSAPLLRRIWRQNLVNLGRRLDEAR